MTASFDLPVIYQGKEVSFTARLLKYGYTHKFLVDVNGTQVLFEPDEESNYRAILDATELQKNNKIDVGLLKTISSAIEAIIK